MEGALRSPQRLQWSFPIMEEPLQGISGKVQKMQDYSPGTRQYRVLQKTWNVRAQKDPRSRQLGSQRDQKCAELDTIILLRTMGFILPFFWLTGIPDAQNTEYYMAWLFENDNNVTYTCCMDPQRVDTVAEPAELELNQVFDRSVI